ncbi:hypothetical protein AM493_07715 [Flavobacterium akiainvivens]|uniref:Secreted protein n=1 Tax=Flavobacterium akiainvivens TaxID=1202724 RepID=A0A0M8M8V8_9FLAO|nr:hypothetical protein [Flavobacterium akiainvivens]KOS05933.1 hypothetical protein AM493_07715 [Flavobacterium akiainvivens]SFQ53390.1 hypothetical protein SAMN05444144_10721 [Flavobacterium akiainvivens]
MKFLSLCIALLAVLHPAFSQETETDSVFIPENNCGFYGPKTVAQRNALFPFKKAKKIKLVAYLGEEDVIHSGQSGEEPVLLRKESVGTGKYKKVYKIVEEKEITGAAVDSISNIMFNYGLESGQNTGEDGHIACYDPRNSVLFYDEKGKLIGNLEICFMCGQAYFEPDEKIMKNLYNLCPDVMYVLNDFFKQQGIKHGTMDENE